MKKSLASALLAAGFALANPAQAIEYKNGTESNSFRLNGMRLNSFRLNGMRLNSFRLNGRMFNGVEWNDIQSRESETSQEVWMEMAHGAASASEEISPWSALPLINVSVRLKSAR